MKSFVKKFLIKIIHPLTTRLGYSINLHKNSSTNKDALLDNFFLTLKSINFLPKHIIDVGANHGAWTRQALEYFPNAYYTLLEPQSWLQDDIKDLITANKNIKFYGVGAGANEGSFKFTIVDRDDSCSFQFSEDEANKYGFKQIDVPVVTINSLLKKENLSNPDIIKIDAEGLDIEVLKGASDCYSKTEIFMVEAGIMNKRVVNSLLNITTYMDNIGYRLYDITDLNRTNKHNVLWLAELVFIKKNGTIDNSINEYS